MSWWWETPTGNSMFTRMMTANPGLCDLAKEWLVLDKIFKWLGLLVYVQSAVLDYCLGICRLEGNGSQNWFWCLSHSFARPCFCPQLAPWVRSDEHSAEQTQELGFCPTLALLLCTVDFAPGWLCGRCVSVPDFPLSLLGKAVLEFNRWFMREEGVGQSLIPKYYFALPSLMYGCLFSCSSHVLAWEMYATKERWEQPNSSQPRL